MDFKSNYNLNIWYIRPNLYNWSFCEDNHADPNWIWIFPIAHWLYFVLCYFVSHLPIFTWNVLTFTPDSVGEYCYDVSQCPEHGFLTAIISQNVSRKFIIINHVSGFIIEIAHVFAKILPKILLKHPSPQTTFSDSLQVV